MPDKPRYYSDEYLWQIGEKFAEISNKTDELLLAFARQEFKSNQAWEYARHGFSRRLGTLRHCIIGVFRTIPPEMSEVPTKAALYDAQVYLQSFIANVYGCVDNLAWVWTYEKGIKIERRRVGLRQKHSELRATFSSEFQNYLRGMSGWFDYLTEYRDALGHRIPLYIPPGSVLQRNMEAYSAIEARIHNALFAHDTAEYDRLSGEQDKLRIFQPTIIHSFNESKGLINFHAQMIADFLTVKELAYQFLDELKRRLADGVG